jgi:hypothetical protein
MMRLLIWNIRGLNQPLKQQEVKKCIRRFHVSIFCLVETRVKVNNVVRIKDVICPSWQLLNNYLANPLGRVWICWDPGIFSIDAISISEQVITCRVNAIQETYPWILSVVYRANHSLDRRRMLTELVRTKDLVGCQPWIIAGDFNAIRFPQETSDNNLSTCYEKEFVECLQVLEVEDVPFTGCFHTWTNKQADMDFVSKKLDRVLSNLEWLRVFPNTSVDFMERGISNHSPALMCIGKLPSFGPKPFNFFNF